jgi:hypothetical protein
MINGKVIGRRMRGGERCIRGDVGVLCRHMRPMQQVEVGFARQWRQVV